MWQRIDTAPATDITEGDPVPILVWVANGGDDGKGCVDLGYVHIRPHSKERRPRANGHTGTGWQITHWMPLPPAPMKTDG